MDGAWDSWSKAGPNCSVLALVLSTRCQSNQIPKLAVKVKQLPAGFELPF